MTENREYKGDVFSMLMEDKKNALQVYNALNGSSHEDPELVDIYTLEKGISLSIRNDAAFIIDMELNIYEHQSSYNPNMPLRSLIYFTTILKCLIKNRDMFSTHLITIPTPHFAVFYNGLKDRPEQETLKLSAAYAKATDEPELELTCTLYNINPDKDTGLLRRCTVLDEYTKFVETVRKFELAEIDAPIEKAIDYCIGNHILEAFLTERRTEVLKAMTIDMTFERREGLIREEEREYGRAEGHAQGVADGVRDTIIQVYRNCLSLGMSQDEAIAISGITDELLKTITPTP
ncbi:MAG: hypothetical protein K6E63_01115 [Lachnospiraceae bacterium]|nr:hypothetical protein [Lachnospiraceae bacterium]